MQLRDQRGTELSTRNPASRDHYERALGLLNGYSGNPLAVIDVGLSEDPEFVSGHVLRAGMLATSTERRAIPELERTLASAEALIARGLGNERERAHLAAANAWLTGNFAGACDRYNRLALEYPRDMLAQQLAHVCNFFLGRASWLRDHVAAVLPQHVPGEASHAYLQGMLAFGLEECGEYERAQQAGRIALEHNPRDPWAVHAVAHCFEMQGRLSEGIAWLQSRESDWAPDSFFAVHNYWHLALFHLDLDDRPRVLELYDRKLRGSSSAVNLDLVDASALLWRLQLAGVEVGAGRWRELADTWRNAAEEGYYAFNDWHALMAYAGAGARDDVARVLEGLVVAAGEPGTNAELTRQVGLPVCTGFAAFADGDYARAIEALFPVRAMAHLFGGSHAQRDLLESTLLEAALRRADHALASSLAQARKAKRPHSPAPLRMLARAHALGAVPESAQAHAERLAPPRLSAD